MERWIIKMPLGLVLVGGINWGLVGFFNFNLVETLLGFGLLSRIVYGIVGISAIISIPMLFKK